MSPKIEDYAFAVNQHGQVLLVGGTLPGKQSETTHFWQSTAEINTALREQFGIQAVATRCLRNRFADGKIINHYLMELLQPPPATASWQEQESVAHLVPEPDSAGAWVRWRDQDHPLRVPWYRPGWFADTESKLRGQLGDVVGPVEQLRAWQRSCVLRVPTAAGAIYAKAIPAFFAHEVPLTRWLKDHFPENIPATLEGGDSDTDDLLLLRDYGGRPLGEVRDVHRWEDALHRYGEMQIGTMQATRELAALDCPKRDLAWLQQGIEPLLTDLAALRAGVAPLSPEEIDRLQAAIPRFQMMCAELAALNLPLALEHGDLWSGQIIVGDEGRILVTDWSDSAITHPFFSLPFFLAEIEIEGAEEHLTAAYLAPWKRQFSSSTIDHALQLAQTLSPLYSAVVYHRHILPNMEIQWEMENMVTYNLRWLLAAYGSTG